MNLYRQKKYKWSGKLIGGPEFRNCKEVVGVDIWMGDNVLDQYILVEYADYESPADALISNFPNNQPITLKRFEAVYRIFGLSGTAMFVRSNDPKKTQKAQTCIFRY